MSPDCGRNNTFVSKTGLSWISNSFILAKIVGSITESEKMVTYLSDQKKQKIFEKFCVDPKKLKLAIRKLVSFIGNSTSTYSGNRFGLLEYRSMLQ